MNLLYTLPKNPSRLQMAAVCLQADLAIDTTPELTDKRVIKISKLPHKHLKERFTLAKQQLSAMYWNTLTLGYR